MGVSGKEPSLSPRRYTDKQDVQNVEKLKDCEICYDRDYVILNRKDGSTTSTSLPPASVLNTSKGRVVQSHDVLTSFDINEIPCPRCRSLKEHAHKLLLKGKPLNEPNAFEVCDHCRLKLSKINKYDKTDNTRKDFMTIRDDVKQDTKQKVKLWLSKMKHFIKGVVVSDDVRKDKPVSDIDTQFEQLCRSQYSPTIVHEPEVKQMFQYETETNLYIHGEDISFKEQDNILSKTVKFTDSISITPSEVFPTDKIIYGTQLIKSDETIGGRLESYEEPLKSAIKSQILSLEDMDKSTVVKEMHDLTLRQIVKGKKEITHTFPYSSDIAKYEGPESQMYIEDKRKNESTKQLQALSEGSKPLYKGLRHSQWSSERLKYGVVTDRKVDNKLYETLGKPSGRTVVKPDSRLSDVNLNYRGIISNLKRNKELPRQYRSEIPKSFELTEDQSTFFFPKTKESKITALEVDSLELIRTTQEKLLKRARDEEKLKSEKKNEKDSRSREDKRFSKPQRHYDGKQGKGIEYVEEIGISERLKYAEDRLGIDKKSEIFKRLEEKRDEDKRYKDYDDKIKPSKETALREVKISSDESEKFKSKGTITMTYEHEKQLRGEEEKDTQGFQKKFKNEEDKRGDMIKEMKSTLLEERKIRDEEKQKRDQEKQIKSAEIETFNRQRQRRDVGIQNMIEEKEFKSHEDKHRRDEERKTKREEQEEKQKFDKDKTITKKEIKSGKDRGDDIKEMMSKIESRDKDIKKTISKIAVARHESVKKLKSKDKIDFRGEKIKFKTEEGKQMHVLERIIKSGEAKRHRDERKGEATYEGNIKPKGDISVTEVEYDKDVKKMLSKIAIEKKRQESEKKLKSKENILPHDEEKRIKSGEIKHTRELEKLIKSGEIKHTRELEKLIKSGKARPTRDEEKIASKKRELKYEDKMKQKDEISVSEVEYDKDVKKMLSKIAIAKKRLESEKELKSKENMLSHDEEKRYKSAEIKQTRELQKHPKTQEAKHSHDEEKMATKKSEIKYEGKMKPKDEVSVSEVEYDKDVKEMLSKIAIAKKRLESEKELKSKENMLSHDEEKRYKSAEIKQTRELQKHPKTHEAKHSHDEEKIATKKGDLKYEEKMKPKDEVSVSEVEYEKEVQKMLSKIAIAKKRLESEKKLKSKENMLSHDEEKKYKSAEIKQTRELQKYLKIQQAKHSRDEEKIATKKGEIKYEGKIDPKDEVSITDIEYDKDVKKLLLKIAMAKKKIESEKKKLKSKESIVHFRGEKKKMKSAEVKQMRELEKMIKREEAKQSREQIEEKFDTRKGEIKFDDKDQPKDEESLTEVEYDEDVKLLLSKIAKAIKIHLSEKKLRSKEKIHFWGEQKKMKSAEVKQMRELEKIIKRDEAKQKRDEQKLVTRKGEVKYDDKIKPKDEESLIEVESDEEVKEMISKIGITKSGEVEKKLKSKEKLPKDDDEIQLIADLKERSYLEKIMKSAEVIKRYDFDEEEKLITRKGEVKSYDKIKPKYELSFTEVIYDDNLKKMMLKIENAKNQHKEDKTLQSKEEVYRDEEKKQIHDEEKKLKTYDSKKHIKSEQKLGIVRETMGEKKSLEKDAREKEEEEEEEEELFKQIEKIRQTMRGSEDKKHPKVLSEKGLLKKHTKTEKEVVEELFKNIEPEPLQVVVDFKEQKQLQEDYETVKARAERKAQQLADELRAQRFFRQAKPEYKPEPVLKELPFPERESIDMIFQRRDIPFFPVRELEIHEVRLMNPSPDDLILQLVKFRQTISSLTRKSLVVDLPLIAAHKEHLKTGLKSSSCELCNDSELQLDTESLEKQNERKEAVQREVLQIIIREKIFNQDSAPLLDGSEGQTIAPLLFKEKYHLTPILTPPKLEDMMPRMEPEPQGVKGIIRYALSDRSFIDKGWTMLPTEKVVRKMNVYRMRPAHPEFDWFEHNKSKRVMTYDTGEKLAAFDDNGRGRWFYRNGRVALDYYDAEETNAQQRYVVYSSGEPDDRGRSRPITILATFDYLGNGIVFNHSGKIRLKYNQTEGVVLDRDIGPVSHWKWHTLNDPPVLQQVMIDTQLSHKDPEIMKLGTEIENKTRPDNEEMLAIEFDNFIKEKSKKLSQKFKPFQIKMKALKINENFSLKVLDQATIYLIFRDGLTNLKLNIGMVLDHQEIVDTDTAEVGEVSNTIERLPARTDSLARLQQSVAHAQRYERQRTERERRLRPPGPVVSADMLTAAAAPPTRPPFRTVPTDATSTTGTCKCKKSLKNLYYNTRLI